MEGSCELAKTVLGDKVRVSDGVRDAKGAFVGDDVFEPLDIDMDIDIAKK